MPTKTQDETAGIAEVPATGYLTREQILAADDVEQEEVDVPEWGGKVIVRCLTGRDRDALDALSVQAQRTGVNPDYRAARVARSLVDANGLRIFSVKDVVALTEKNGAVLDRLDDIVVRVSHLSPLSVEEAIKRLKALRSGDTGSD